MLDSIPYKYYTRLQYIKLDWIRLDWVWAGSLKKSINQIKKYVIDVVVDQQVAYLLARLYHTS